MKIQPLSNKFHRAVSISLITSLILLNAVSVQAEINQSCSNCSTKVQPIQSPLGPSISTLIGSLTDSAPTTAALTALIQELQSGDRTLTNFQSRLTAAGVNSNTSAQAAEVAGSLTEAEVRAILRGDRSSVPIPGSGVSVASSQPGVLLASSQLETVAQGSSSANAAVSGLYNTFNQAFIAGGVTSTQADRNAVNLVVALSSIKGTLRNNGYISLREVNRLVKAIDPSIAALPGLLQAVNNNPSVERFQQIQDTVSALELVGIYIKAVNSSV